MDLPWLQKVAHAGFELGTNLVGRITLADVETPAKQVPQQAVGLVLCFGYGATFELAGRLGQELDPVLKFVEQAALADASLGNECNHAGSRRLGCDVVVGILQYPQLGCAPNCARLDALHTTRGQTKRTCFRRFDEIRAHRLMFALDNQRLLGFDIENAAHETVGVV